jgi:hypothetical protein
MIKDGVMVSVPTEGLSILYHLSHGSWVLEFSVEVSKNKKIFREVGVLGVRGIRETE